jgi:hypothetical protein
MAAAVTGGYATAGTDTGHVANTAILRATAINKEEL